MISIVNFETGMEDDLWKVYFSAIRLICISDYSEKQVQVWAPDQFDMEIWAKKLQELNPFVAKIGSTLVGYADLQTDGLIDHFFVHGEHQSVGVGTMLMNSILQKGHNMEKLYSRVSMTAKPFFQHHGFVVIKEQVVEIRGEQLINNVMQRNHG